MTDPYELQDFDRNCLDVLAEAERLAQRLGERYVDVKHVVHCALADSNVKLSLAAVGVDVEPLAQEIADSVGEVGRVFVSKPLQAALNRASAMADVVTIGEMLAAIAEEPGEVSALLARYDVDAATLRRKPSNAPVTERLNDDARQCIDRAREVVSRFGHDQVESQHLLLAILEVIDERAGETPRNLNLLRERMQTKLRNRQERLLPDFSDECYQLIADLPHDEIGVIALLAALKRASNLD